MTATVILTGDRQRSYAKRMIDAAPAGYVCSVREQRRSTAQNAALWARLTDVARCKPDGREHTPEVWKLLFMAALGHETRFEMGLDGRPFPTGFSTSKLSKQQMGDLLTFIDAWGSEHGVNWTHGDEA